MHYKVRGFTILTENAAKPLSQANKTLLGLLYGFPPHIRVLDFGCGKFRYTIPLAERYREVVAVDSSFQIDRVQQINDCHSTLREYARKRLSNVAVHDVSTSTWRAGTYNLIVCANVLSTIPRLQLRIQVLRWLRGLLAPDGRIIISSQYRNSYFSSYGERADAERYADGWLLKTPRGAYFYGIIGPERLRATCHRAGLSVNDLFCSDGSAYAIATNG